MAKDANKETATAAATEDGIPPRQQWGKSVEFILSCIGYSVGLGNIWRWPYLCFSNGGGAFLFPYWFMVIAIGIPMFYLELCYGQFSSLGVTKVWRISPFWKGIGFAMCVCSLLTCISYNMVVSYTIYYLFKSFAATLPWASCDNSWNTPRCLILQRNMTGIYNASHFGGKPLCDPSLNITNDVINCTNRKDIPSPTFEFWENHVLGLSKSFEDIGVPQVHLIISLLVAWVLVALCLVKGIGSTGKVVYFTATFPYVILTILLVRGATLDGCIDGWLYLFTPQWDRLKEAGVWKAAAGQVFYSLGTAVGGLLTMASYNKFSHNCQRDAVIVALTDTFTSFYGGLVIFSILGFMAHERGVKVDEIATSGTGLAFIAYPEAVMRMPNVPPLWSCLFFFMLMILGLDTMFTTLETLITACIDEYPKTRKVKLPLTIGLCVAQFLLGIPLCCNGGQYLQTIVDEYASGFSLLFIALFEVFVIVTVYGPRRFSMDIKCMLGFKPNIYWMACWVFVTPVTILFIIIFACVKFETPTYNDYVYSEGAVALGWLSLCASVACIPIGMVIQFWRYYDGNALRTLKRLNWPEDDWGPAKPEDRRKRLAMDDRGYYTRTPADIAAASADNMGFDDSTAPSGVYALSARL